MKSQNELSVSENDFDSYANFVRPAFEGKSFYNVIQSIERICTGCSLGVPFTEGIIVQSDSIKKVVFILIDGFGWNSFERVIDSAFLAEVQSKGMVSRITSQFPSTTSAHVCTMSTGLSPIQHGLFEWNIFLPNLGCAMNPLPYQSVHGLTVSNLSEEEVSPDSVYPRQTLYQRLSENKVNSLFFCPSSIVNSITSRYLTRGVSDRIGYSSLKDLEQKWRDVANADYWDYAAIYYDKFDALSHRFGHGSFEAQKCLVEILSTLNAIIECGQKDTLFLVTADHGQINVSPRSDYIEIKTLIPSVESVIKRYGPRHELLPPSGALRNLFLHVENEAVKDVVAEINSTIGDKVAAFSVDDLCRLGLFGPTYCDRHLGRLGTVGLLPLGETSLFWDDSPLDIKNNKGHHGGATADEMYIPLLSFIA